VRVRLDCGHCFGPLYPLASAVVRGDAAMESARRAGARHPLCRVELVGAFLDDAHGGRRPRVLRRPARRPSSRVRSTSAPSEGDRYRGWRTMQVEPWDCEHRDAEETGFSHEVSVGPAHHGTIWEGGTCRDCGSTVTRPRSPSRDPVWILRTPRDPEAYLEHEAEERGVRLSWTEKDGAVVVGIKGDPSRTRMGNVRSEAPDATASASVSAVGHAQRGTPAAHSAPTTGGLVRERA
jgi:hypothetical protein